ncbi:MAG: histidinol dehydrogenase, partial [Thaumarchaeota archaeon]|nr:histidinol dehydrogenase [Nitrososphaerota archaeon]
AAKLQVLDRVAIDLPAGPSEALIIADRNAEPRIVARDVICQAEHGSESVCGLLTDSEEFAGKVLNVLQSMLRQAGRREIISKALAAKGFTIICKDMEDAARFADSFAPEHLEIMADNAENIASRIRTAGLILVGEYSPAAATDYCVGTNHVLPTGGFGRVYSGLSILDYVRRYHVVECTEEGLKSIAGEVELLAEKEGLPNHAEAVRERFRSVG